MTPEAKHYHCKYCKYEALSGGAVRSHMKQFHPDKLNQLKHNRRVVLNFCPRCELDLKIIAVELAKQAGKKKAYVNFVSCPRCGLDLKAIEAAVEKQK